MAGSRCIVVAGAALILVASSGVLAQPLASGLLAPAEHNRRLAQLEQRPMVFYLARGPAGSCGPGCDEWIAAEGTFVRGTAQRFEEFLATLVRYDLPVFFHSRGGNTGDAVRVGRTLRDRRMSASVGRTTAEHCRVFVAQDPCQRLIALGGAIKAQLRSAEGQCHSACVIALVGASSRRIASGAILGVHSSRFDAKLRQQEIARSPSVRTVTIADLNLAVQRYLGEMDVDPRLQQLASTIDARRIYVLSRDELMRFGIDTGGRYDAASVPFAQRPKHGPAVKLATQVMDAERKAQRAVALELRCLRGQPWLVYQRELQPNEIGQATVVSVATVADVLALQRAPRSGASEVWAVPAALPLLRAVAQASRLIVIERAIPSNNGASVSREIRVSTSGLSAAVGSFVSSCLAAPPSDRSGSDARKHDAKKSDVAEGLLN